MAACEVDNLLLGHSGNAVELLYLGLPVASVDECVDISVGTLLVIVERLQEFEFHVVDDSRQQLVAEFTLLKLLYFGKDEALHFVKALTLVRHSGYDELRVVAHGIVESLGSLATHWLIDVEVEQSCLAVVQNRRNHLKRIVLQSCCAIHLPCHHDVISLFAYDG